MDNMTRQFYIAAIAKKAIFYFDFLEMTPLPPYSLDLAPPCLFVFQTRI